MTRKKGRERGKGRVPEPKPLKRPPTPSEAMMRRMVPNVDV
jgi:hypothetical protein